MSHKKKNAGNSETIKEFFQIKKETIKEGNIRTGLNLIKKNYANSSETIKEGNTWYDWI